MKVSFLFAALAWFIICSFILLLSVFNADPLFRLYYSNALQTIGALLSALFCYRTMMAYPMASPMAKVWFFIGSGLLAWGIGAILFSAYPILNDGQETPYPWYSDLGYLALPPFMIIALGILNRTLGLAAPIWGKIAAFVMFLVSVTASLSVNWDGLIDDDLLLKLVSAAYILVDPILLGAIVFMASAFRSGEVGEVWWYVVSGLIIYFLGNQAYTYLVFTEQYATGSPIDISWPLGFGLLALAAVVNRNLLLSHK